MSIENAVKDVITAKLAEGMIERLVAENLEKGVNESLKKLLGSYGDITEVVTKKIKDVMVKQLESFDYSEYVVKLDCVLAEILKRTSLDNKKILDNFKELMVDSEFPKVVKLSDIFNQFKRFVSKNINTSKLEVNYDDGVSYEYASVSMEVEHEEKRAWSSSSFEYAKAIFECEKDESLNFEIRLSKFMKYGWSLSAEIDTSIASLRRLDELKIYLLKLKQSGADIEIDSDYLEDDVEVEAKPEASFE